MPCLAQLARNGPVLVVVAGIAEARPARLCQFRSLANGGCGTWLAWDDREVVDAFTDIEAVFVYTIGAVPDGRFIQADDLEVIPSVWTNDRACAASEGDADGVALQEHAAPGPKCS